MSVIKNLYDAIVAKLGAVDDIKTVGKWNNQILNDDREIQFNYPAVFVDINAEWENTDQRPQYIDDNRTYQQKGQATVTFHIIDKRLEYTSATIGDALDLAKIVWDNMIFLNGDDYGPMQRTASLDDTDHDIARDWQEVYICPVVECPNTDNVTDVAALGTVAISLDAEFDPDPFIKP